MICTVQMFHHNKITSQFANILAEKRRHYASFKSVMLGRASQCRRLSASGPPAASALTNLLSIDRNCMLAPEQAVRPQLDIRGLIAQSPERFALNLASRRHVPPRLDLLAHIARLHIELTQSIAHRQRLQHQRKCHSTETADFKRELSTACRLESALSIELTSLAASVPNETHFDTPVGDAPRLIRVIGCFHEKSRERFTHAAMAERLEWMLPDEIATKRVWSSLPVPDERGGAAGAGTSHVRAGASGPPRIYALHPA